MGKVVIVLAVLLACGCNKETKVFHVSDDGQWLPPRSGPGLVADEKPAIPDVPTPIGFSMVAAKSHAVAVGQARNIRYVFQGQAELGETMAFFRENVVRFGWSGRVEKIEGRKAALWFGKGQERLTIEMVANVGIVTVTIWVNEQSRTPPQGVP
ncbi:MAG: hypothetical protein IT443_10615 [Phycisphaeraceae bacterium]|nr:hypothetical protein [Phycisphaeraceae bacterium]